VQQNPQTSEARAPVKIADVPSGSATVSAIV
jgi:hypothetical protein